MVCKLPPNFHVFPVGLASNVHQYLSKIIEKKKNNRFLFTLSML